MRTTSGSTARRTSRNWAAAEGGEAEAGAGWPDGVAGEGGGVGAASAGGAGADALRDAVAVLTIHDAGFQGICAPEWLGMLGMSRSLFTVDGLEFWGQVNLLKGGIVFADAVTTIGSTYAARLLAGERPCGLEGLLAARRTTVLGLIDDGADRGAAAPDLGELARGAAGLFARLRVERGQPLRA